MPCALRFHARWCTITDKIFTGYKDASIDTQAKSLLTLILQDHRFHALNMRRNEAPGFSPANYGRRQTTSIVRTQRLKYGSARGSGGRRACV